MTILESLNIAYSFNIIGFFNIASEILEVTCYSKNKFIFVQLL